MRKRAREDAVIAEALRAAIECAVKAPGSTSHDRLCMMLGWLLGHVTDIEERKKLASAIFHGKEA